jgi:hypothetical protein
METLRSHTEMIDLNPLVEERHPIKPPPHATAEEFHCLWYSLTDRVQYLPGGIMSGKVSYDACFHDLENGLQTHVYAPMGLNIKGKWTLGGSLPGEPVAPVELGVGAPLHGLYLREDVDMRCNIMMTTFVKRTLKKAHSKLVDRLVVKAQILDASIKNQQLETAKLYGGSLNESQASDYSPSEYGPESTDGNSYNFLPPQRPISGFQVEYMGTTGNDNNLYPRALSMHSSSASYHGSINESQRSFQEPGNPNGVRENRVSWQNLTPNRSPSTRQVDASHYQVKGAYQTQLPPAGHPYYSAPLHPLQMNNPQELPNNVRSENNPSSSFAAELE